MEVLFPRCAGSLKVQRSVSTRGHGSGRAVVGSPLLGTYLRTSEFADSLESSVERSHLAHILAGADGVRLLSRAALGAGVDYKVWPEGVATQRLISIYERRERGTRRSGQPSFGFAEALDALRAYDGAELAIGFIDDRRRGGYYFQLFLDPELGSVVACFGVKSTRDLQDS